MENINSVDIVFTNDQTKWTKAVIVEAQEKDLPEIGSSPSIRAEADQIDENGYSWLMHEGKQWYRTNSESHWFEFVNYQN